MQIAGKDVLFCEPLAQFLGDDCFHLKSLQLARIDSRRKLVPADVA